jgi:hypothetical protein
MAVDRELCLQILDEICAHPIAQAFVLPMSDSSYVDPDYRKRVPNPMDIQRIRSQVDAGGYSISRFQKDFRLISSNAVRYFGPDTEFGAAANQLNELFQKILVRRRASAEYWGIAVAKLQRKMGRMLANRPIMPGRGDQEIDVGAQIRSQLISESELKNFAEAAKKLQQPRDVDQMIRIVEEREGNPVPSTQKVTVDLGKLKPSTIRLLIDFAKKTCHERGIEYPSSL